MFFSYDVVFIICQCIKYELFMFNMRLWLKIGLILRLLFVIFNEYCQECGKMLLFVAIHKFRGFIFELYIAT